MRTEQREAERTRSRGSTRIRPRRAWCGITFGVEGGRDGSRSPRRSRWAEPQAKLDPPGEEPDTPGMSGRIGSTGERLQQFLPVGAAQPGAGVPAGSGREGPVIADRDVAQDARG